MAYEDRNLTCVECNSEFAFSADDQDFHAQRGYQDPKRCPSCRQARRGGGGGGYGGGGGGGGGGYGGGSRQMYDATCASCGSACQVPFLPRQDRPVYCSDCFSKEKTTKPRW
ncbi:MAG: CxxC-x17-CxxC domain-containing protein [Dehalococcoidia bacterium]